MRRPGGVAFGTRKVVALLEPRDLLGIEPEHLVASRRERLHPQPPVSLDRHHHLARITIGGQVRGDQLMQPGDPGRALGQPPGGQLAARLVLDLHIVVILGPVISDEQQVSRFSLHRSHGGWSWQPAGERLAR